MHNQITHKLIYPRRQLRKIKRCILLLALRNPLQHPEGEARRSSCSPKCPKGRQMLRLPCLSALGNAGQPPPRLQEKTLPNRKTENFFLPSPSHAKLEV